MLDFVHNNTGNVTKTSVVVPIIVQDGLGYFPMDKSPNFTRVNHTAVKGYIWRGDGNRMYYPDFVSLENGLIPVNTYGYSVDMSINGGLPANSGVDLCTKFVFTFKQNGKNLIGICFFCDPKLVHQVMGQ